MSQSDLEILRAIADGKYCVKDVLESNVKADLGVCRLTIVNTHSPRLQASRITIKLNKAAALDGDKKYLFTNGQPVRVLALDGSYIKVEGKRENAESDFEYPVRVVHKKDGSIEIPKIDFPENTFDNLDAPASFLPLPDQGSILIAIPKMIPDPKPEPEPEPEFVESHPRPVIEFDERGNSIDFDARLDKDLRQSQSHGGPITTFDQDAGIAGHPQGVQPFTAIDPDADLENKVLNMLSGGHKVEEISQQLRISRESVEDIRNACGGRFGL